MEYSEYTERAACVILHNDQILLMHRIKNGREYYVFPGGSVEKNDSPTETAIRELQEEFTIDVKIDKKLFENTNTLNNRTRHEHYFLVTNFTGTPTLGGEEKDRMDENNQYYPAWIRISDLANTNLKPDEAKEKVLKFLTGGAKNGI